MEQRVLLGLGPTIVGLGFSGIGYSLKCFGRPDDGHGYSGMRDSSCTVV